MTVKVSTIRSLAIAIALAAGLSACATNRSVVEIKQPPSAATQTKAVAKITDVRDLRRFDVNPRDPSLPSIGDENEIKDLKITSRAIGRKRNGYGMALGDVMLPETTNVATLVRNAATRALQENGYRVVDASSPDFNTAIPLAIDIEQFWAWVTPGMFEGSMDFDSRTVLTGPLVDPSPTIVTGKSHKGIGAAFESYWIEVVQNGLNDLAEKMKTRIKPAS